MKVAGTGHRPHKLGGYDRENSIRLRNFARRCLSNIEREHNAQLEVISGMALGWDTALAEAALELHLPLHAYIPFHGQENSWPVESQKNYYNILRHATTVRHVSEGRFSVAKLHIRNEAMVDACDLLLALWDGSGGGTSNCVHYANKHNVPIENVWGEYERYALNE